MRQNIDQYKASTQRGAILVFGPPKSGKTRSISTLFKAGIKPIWYFDFESGDAIEPFIRAARQYGAKSDDIVRFSYTPARGDKIGDTEFRPRGQGKDIFLDFLKDFNTLYDSVGPDGEWNKPGMPAAIVFDSTTALQEIILDFVLTMTGHNLGAKGTDSRADYGRQMNKIVEIITSAKALPCLSIFIAHEKMDKNELTSELRIDPSFTGQLAQQIAREFGTVLYSTTKKEGANVRYIWKTRSEGYVKSPGVRHYDNLQTEVEQDFANVLQLSGAAKD